MKNIIMCAKMFSVMLTILVVTGIIWNIFGTNSEGERSATEISEQSEKMPEEIVQTEVTELDVTDAAAMEETQITQADIEKEKIKLELVQSRLDEVQPQLEFYQSLPEQLSAEVIEEIAQSRILQCYEENVVLAVEAKTLLMSGLGVPVPSGFNTTRATDDYEEYLKEEITESIVGQIGSENVQNAVRYGIDGALEAYEADGSLSSVLSGAVDSVVEGVVADIQDYPYQLAKGILDETTGGLYSIAEGLITSDSPEDFLNGLADEKTGGLIGSIGSIANYDKTPTAFFQNLSKSASESAAELESFLDKDTVNSEDIANMMYQYSMFGEAMHDLNGYDWSIYYDNMKTVYSQFIRNEIMIELLGEEVIYEENQ